SVNAYNQKQGIAYQAKVGDVHPIFKPPFVQMTVNAPKDYYNRQILNTGRGFDGANSLRNGFNIPTYTGQDLRSTISINRVQGASTMTLSGKNFGEYTGIAAVKTLGLDGKTVVSHYNFDHGYLWSNAVNKVSGIATNVNSLMNAPGFNHQQYKQQAISFASGDWINLQGAYFDGFNLRPDQGIRANRYNSALPTRGIAGFQGISGEDAFTDPFTGVKLTTTYNSATGLVESVFRPQFTDNRFTKWDVQSFQRKEGSITQTLIGRSKNDITTFVQANRVGANLNDFNNLKSLTNGVQVNIDLSNQELQHTRMGLKILTSQNTLMFSYSHLFKPGNSSGELAENQQNAISNLGQGVVLDWISPIAQNSAINIHKGSAGMLISPQVNEQTGAVTGHTFSFLPTYSGDAVWNNVPTVRKLTGENNTQTVAGKELQRIDTSNMVRYSPDLRIGKLEGQRGLVNIGRDNFSGDAFLMRNLNKAPIIVSATDRKRGIGSVEGKVSGEFGYLIGSNGVEGITKTLNKAAQKGYLPISNELLEVSGSKFSDLSVGIVDIFSRADNKKLRTEYTYFIGGEGRFVVNNFKEVNSPSPEEIRVNHTEWTAGGRDIEGGIEFDTANLPQAERGRARIEFELRNEWNQPFTAEAAWQYDGAKTFIKNGNQLTVNGSIIKAGERYSYEAGKKNIQGVSDYGVVKFMQWDKNTPVIGMFGGSSLIGPGMDATYATSVQADTSNLVQQVRLTKNQIIDRIHQLRSDIEAGKVSADRVETALKTWGILKDGQTMADIDTALRQHWLNENASAILPESIEAFFRIKFSEDISDLSFIRTEIDKGINGLEGYLGSGLDLDVSKVNGYESMIKVNGKEFSSQSGEIVLRDGKLYIDASGESDVFNWINIPVDIAKPGNTAAGGSAEYPGEITLTNTDNVFISALSKGYIPTSISLNTLSGAIAMQANVDIMHFGRYFIKGREAGDFVPFFLGGSLSKIKDGGEVIYTRNSESGQWDLSFSDKTQIAEVFEIPFIGSNLANIKRLHGNEYKSSDIQSKVAFLGIKHTNAVWQWQENIGEDGRPNGGTFVPLGDNGEIDFNKYFALHSKALYETQDGGYGIATVFGGKWNPSLKTFTLGVYVSDSDKPIDVFRNNYIPPANAKNKVATAEEKQEAQETTQARVAEINKNWKDMGNLDYHTALTITSLSSKRVLGADGKSVAGWVDSAKGTLGMSLDFWGNSRSLAGLPGTIYKVSEARGALADDGTLINPFYVRETEGGNRAVWGGNALVDYKLDILGTKGTKFSQEQVYELKRTAVNRVIKPGTAGPGELIAYLDLGLQGTVRQRGVWDSLTEKRITSKVVDLFRREAGTTIAINSLALIKMVYLTAQGYWKHWNHRNEDERAAERATAIEGAMNDNLKKDRGSFINEAIARLIYPMSAKSLAWIYGRREELNIQKLVYYVREERIKFNINFEGAETDISGSITGVVSDLLSGKKGDIRRYGLNSFELVGEGNFFSVKGNYWMPRTSLFEVVLDTTKKSVSQGDNN
ncbi:MAG: hypothetical protein NG712_04660, partial [Omnitrophica bacterium]|nr:hypothetical protein [Candidatus Omnitrophota bacterium]